MPAGTLVHSAGVELTVNGVVRQRCQWCGALLIEYDLANVQVMVEPDGSLRPPGVFEPSAQVAVNGGASWVVPKEPSTVHEGEWVIPENFCALLDPTSPASIGEAMRCVQHAEVPVRATPEQIAMVKESVEAQGVCGVCDQPLQGADGEIDVTQGENGWQHADRNTCFPVSKCVHCGGGFVMNGPMSAVPTSEVSKFQHQDPEVCVRRKKLDAFKAVY
jgi:hypothetical protein